MAIVTVVPTGGWVVQLTGAPSDILRIASELVGDELQISVHGESLYIQSPELDDVDTEATAEWAAYNLVGLITASAHLCFGVRSPIRLVGVTRGRGGRSRVPACMTNDQVSQNRLSLL